MKQYKVSRDVHCQCGCDQVIRPGEFVVIDPCLEGLYFKPEHVPAEKETAAVK